MIFQQSAIDEWVEMSRVCMGILMKCSHHPNPDIVAMATAKLHTVLQLRASEDLHELGYLMFSINKALNAAIEGNTFKFKLFEIKFDSKFKFNSFAVGDSDSYSFLMPVLKALLEKSRSILSLDTNVPDLPPTSSGPVFFNDFQMFSGTKQWTSFIEKKVCLRGFLFVMFLLLFCTLE